MLAVENYARTRRADRYERGSLLITSNLPFSEWVQVFQGERMTAALPDRLTHDCHIFEINGESYRFRESMKEKRPKHTPKDRPPKKQPHFARKKRKTNRNPIRGQNFSVPPKPGKGLAGR